MNAYLFPFFLGQSLDDSGSIGAENYTSVGVGLGAYEMQIRISDILKAKYLRLEFAIAFFLFQRDNGTIGTYPLGLNRFFSGWSVLCHRRFSDICGLVGRSRHPCRDRH